MSQSAEELISLGNRKLSESTFFGLLSRQKNEQAANFFYKGATQYKINKKWLEAGDTFCLAGKHYELAKDFSEAINAFINAGNCYKNISTSYAIRIFTDIAYKLKDNNEFSRSARIFEDVADLHLAEQKLDIQEILNCYENCYICYKFSNLYELPRIKEKQADFLCSIGRYETASNIYEQYDIIDKLLFCQFLINIKYLPNIELWLDKINIKYPIWSKGPEYTFLKNLFELIQKGEFHKFHIVIQQYDFQYKISNWQLMILTEIKQKLLAIINEYSPQNMDILGL